jgi:hypothetical protein
MSETSLLDQAHKDAGPARSGAILLGNEATRRTIWDKESTWLPAMPTQIGAVALCEAEAPHEAKAQQEAAEAPHEADDGDTIVRGLE